MFPFSSNVELPGAIALLVLSQSLWPSLLALVSGLLLLSGIDDFVPVLICLRQWLRDKYLPLVKQDDLHPVPTRAAERRIAIFVPCWKESGVIANMVRHNLATLQYSAFDIFLGAYPNDEATVEVVTGLSETFANVHAAICPHPGPTSKADCLNSIYRGMCFLEQQEDKYFDTVVLHDSEDVIHPQSLNVIDKKRELYAMVQVPVLPIATSFREMTHAIYCDEFSEFQTIDMCARQFCGSFVPSNGVGTGFAREILEQLATERGGVIFDPKSLTEDYEIGVYAHHAGFKQCFGPLTRTAKDFIATREYFPMSIRSAIRQLTRWVTGIALQCWEHVGWRGSVWTRYWFWRDRKGLIANPLSLLTNVLFLAGAIDWFQSIADHRPWAFAISNPHVILLCWSTTIFQCFRLSLRMACVARLFGIRFAAGVPLRSFHANFINCCATFRAVWRYTHARLNNRGHVWLKTEHAYPTGHSLQLHRRELAEVLLGSGFLSEEDLAAVLHDKPAETQLAEFLLTSRMLSEADLCRAVSLQSGVPSARVDIGRVKRRVVRCLPLHFEKRYGIVPFKIQAGRLHVAGQQVPPQNAWNELKHFTQLPVEFQLVTRGNYEQLRQLLF